MFEADAVFWSLLVKAVVCTQVSVVQFKLFMNNEYQNVLLIIATVNSCISLKMSKAFHFAGTREPAGPALCS